MISEKRKWGLIMQEFGSVLAIIGGFVLMSGGSYMLVQGASSLAKVLGVSEMVIGVTIVAFGTSLPELITVVISSAKNSDSIGFGNIVGSNIINVLGILGLAVMIAPIKVDRAEVTLATWIAFVAASLYVVYCLAFRKGLTRYDGAILFTGFLLFNYFNYFAPKK